MYDFFVENLRSPALSRCTGLMRQFRSGQLDSINLYNAATAAMVAKVGGVFGL
jgi:hypothetical protein